MKRAVIFFIVLLAVSVMGQVTEKITVDKEWLDRYGMYLEQPPPEIGESYLLVLKMDDGRELLIGMTGEDSVALGIFQDDSPYYREWNLINPDARVFERLLIFIEDVIAMVDSIVVSELMKEHHIKYTNREGKIIGGIK